MHWMLILLLLGLARPVIATDMTAYTEELPPLNYQDGGQVSGFATELLQAVMQQAGYSVDIQLMPWARAYRLVMEGPDRIIYSITRTPQREPLFHWVGPISPRQIKLYRLNSRSDIQINSEADLSRYKLGAMFESAAAQKLAGLGLAPDQGLDLGASDAVTLKKLLQGQTELVAMLDWAMAWQLKQQGIEPRRVRPVWLLDGGHQYWFALSRATPVFKVRQLQAALNQVSADGRLQKLRQKYLSE